ncbi:hypothetical protein BH09ACT1_BH09ACT1_22190 [soil metagenome]
MELIHYAGNSVLTGTELAHALVDYAEALALKGSSATVEIPSRLDDGSIGTAHFLIGPASQLVSETVVTDEDEIEAPEIVANFRHETALLGEPHAVPEEAPGDHAGIDDPDMYGIDG